MIDEILKILRESDSYAAAQHIQRDGSADEIAKRYSELSKELYWKKKDVCAAISIGRCGILYCLIRSSECDGESADRLRGVAKGIAFNMASFAWPGWGEPGISITPADLAAGRDAAKLNLRLAVELRRPAEPMMNAHWMIGAYFLADGRTAEAIAAFENAERFGEQAEEPAAVAMCRSYSALARLAGDSSCEGEFVESLGALRQIESKDSAFYVEQLETARRVFVHG